MSDFDLAEELICRLDYNPMTGEFVWLEHVGGLCRGVGSYAGTIDWGGYRVITWRGKRFKGHRLAWQISFGYAPTALDHINGDRADNRLINLRETTAEKNGHNRREHRNGKLVGTSQRKNGKWFAQFWREGKRIHVGTFGTQIEAHEAYKRARHESI